jgi:hypothetical protein
VLPVGAQFTRPRLVFICCEFSIWARLIDRVFYVAPIYWQGFLSSPGWLTEFSMWPQLIDRVFYPALVDWKSFLCGPNWLTGFSIQPWLIDRVFYVAPIDWQGFLSKWLNSWPLHSVGNTRPILSGQNMTPRFLIWSISTNISTVLANFLGIHNPVFSKNIGRDCGNTKILTYQMR